MAKVVAGPATVPAKRAAPTPRPGKAAPARSTVSQPSKRGSGVRGTPSGRNAVPTGSKGRFRFGQSAPDHVGSGRGPLKRGR